MFCKNENSDKGNWIGKDDQYEKTHSEKPLDIFLYLILTITVCWTLKVLLEGCHRSCSLLNDCGFVLWTDWAFLTDKDTPALCLNHCSLSSSSKLSSVSTWWSSSKRSNYSLIQMLSLSSVIPLTFCLSVRLSKSSLIPQDTKTTPFPLLGVTESNTLGMYSN